MARRNVPSPVDEFEALRQSLSRNDPVVTINSGIIPKLGTSLLNNTHVTFVRIIVENSALIDEILVLQSSSSTSEDEAVQSASTRLQEFLNPMLDYLRTTGPALQHVCIEGHRQVDATTKRILVRLLLDAIGQNQHIRELSLVDTALDIPELCTFLSETTALQKLKLRFLHDTEHTLERRNLLKGLMLNTSLRTLEIEWSLSMTSSILTCLANKTNCQLQELKVASGFLEEATAFWQALSLYLRSKTTVLDHLSLIDFSRTLDSTESFVRFFQGFLAPNQDGCPCFVRSIASKLTLSAWIFDGEGATAVLRDFLQTKIAVPVPAASPSSTTMTPRPVRELVLETEYFDTTVTALELISMLCMPQVAALPVAPGDVGTGNGVVVDGDASASRTHPATASVNCEASVSYYATIGSQIQGLSICEDHSCFPGLYQGLADHADRIRLETLHVPDGAERHDVGFVGLAQCITKVTSLREVVFTDAFLNRYNGDLPLPIARSLKENGHVQAVSSNVQSRLVHAYCERNRHLGPLLLQSSVGSSDGDCSSDESLVSSHKTTGQSSFCPTLWLSAMQLPTLQSSMVTRTLLRIPDDESIGPARSSALRLRDDSS